MEYDVSFGVYREDGQPIPEEVIERLTVAWVAAVEKEGLWTGGGITETRLLDTILLRLWIFLWRFKCLRRTV